MKFPPKTEKETAAWLAYQKKEGLALDLVPLRLKINGNVLDIPDEIRERIAQTDDFVNEMRGILEQWLMAEHMGDYLLTGGEYQFL